jgi:hypothetical protein
MTKTSDTVDYRVASRDYETDIFAVLEEVAPEIPVLLDTPARQDAIRGIIVECRKSGKSWVAVDANGTVVGFALARPDLHEAGAISLRYVGVSGNSRRRGIFATYGKADDQWSSADRQCPAHQSFRHGKSSCEDWIHESGIRCQGSTIAVAP